MTVLCLCNISVSEEIDGSSGLFRATCANSSLNVNRNWNRRSSFIVLCPLALRPSSTRRQNSIRSLALRLRQHQASNLEFSEHENLDLFRLSCKTPAKCDHSQRGLRARVESEVRAALHV